MSEETHGSDSRADTTADARIGRAVLVGVAAVVTAVVSGLVLTAFQSSGNSESNMQAAILLLQTNLNSKEAAIIQLETEVNLLNERITALRKDVKDIDTAVDQYRETMAQGQPLTLQEWGREDRRISVELQSLRADTERLDRTIAGIIQFMTEEQRESRRNGK